MADLYGDFESSCAVRQDGLGNLFGIAALGKGGADASPVQSITCDLDIGQP